MTETAPSTANRLDNTVKAIGLVTLSYLLNTFSDAALKWVLPEVGSAGAMFWRGCFGALSVLLLGQSWRRGALATLRPHNGWLLFGRGAFNCLVSLLYYVAWTRGMSLVDTYVVAATTPLILTVMAVPLLGEKVGWRRWTSTTVGLAGVLFMLQPGGALWRPESLLMLLAVTLLAVTRIWTRMLARTDRPESIAFWLMVAQILGGIASYPFFPAEHFIPRPTTLLLLAMCSMFYGFMHFTIARAYAMAPVSVLAPIEYSPILWGLGLGLAIWGELPSWTTIIGAVVVIAAGLFNLHRERVRLNSQRIASEALAMPGPATPPRPVTTPLPPPARARAS
ncbi:DMT family transporter [Roseomonas elaeocarpi]|uniref:DMT family transporter n=1 Tax=Roseomonas elaeocarpi TaxID=907779 RepID=A0ABV6JUA7_9PROT